MSEPTNAVDAAIERGGATARLLIDNRDKLFEPMAALLLVTGAAGLRACAAGVVEAVIAAHQRAAWGPKAIALDVDPKS